MTYKDTYTISFYLDEPNWVSLSSIDKDTFYSFTKYLYSLKRKIVVLPYISGGFAPPIRPMPNKDNTYKVLDIVKDIEQKINVHKMLNHHISNKNFASKRYSHTHFNEDMFEELICMGLTKKAANNLLPECKYKPNIKEVEHQLLNIKGIKHSKAKSFINFLKSEPHIHHSRWEFIYMFRNEFKNYMNDKGYNVNVVGGWVLNNKEREYNLGLIDENGNLF